MQYMLFGLHLINLLKNYIFAACLHWTFVSFLFFRSALLLIIQNRLSDLFICCFETPSLDFIHFHSTFEAFASYNYPWNICNAKYWQLAGNDSKVCWFRWNCSEDRFHITRSRTSNWSIVGSCCLQWSLITATMVYIMWYASWYCRSYDE